MKELRYILFIEKPIITYLSLIFVFIGINYINGNKNRKIKYHIGENIVTIYNKHVVLILKQLVIFKISFTKYNFIFQENCAHHQLLNTT